MTIILGISAFYHDSAAALIKDGKIVAAAQEERFTRIKHDAAFPVHAIEYVIKEAGIKSEDITAYVFYDKPFLKFERIVQTYVANAPKGFASFSKAMPVWLREKLFLKKQLAGYIKKIDKSFTKEQLFFTEHHFSHVASAFYPSPYDEAIILVLDGVGEWVTSTIALGRNNKIEILDELHFPNSLGLLYSAFTYYTGFKVNSGEYKLMGLAPYGEPKYRDVILKELIDLKEDGSFRLNQRYFNYMTGLKMINQKFESLFGQPARDAEKEYVTQFHMDIAASIQKVTEEVVLNIAKFARKTYGIENLCLAGGVALNCVANGKLSEEKIFNNIWVQPASGDAGGSLGAALGYWFHELENPRTVEADDSMQGGYLGPAYEARDIEQDLQKSNAVYSVKTNEELVPLVADAIVNDKVVGWFQGRMEFGPRALGARSILGNPKSENMQKVLNLKVKFRESFRPFAPAVLREDITDWFDTDVHSPYMLMVHHINAGKMRHMTAEEEALFGISKLNVVRSEIPAVTHVDYSARIQTVDGKYNARFYELLQQLKRRNGCPVVINTSFNIRGEPIVCTPQDAFRCFMGTDMDILVIENFVLYKELQTVKQDMDYKSSYALD